MLALISHGDCLLHDAGPGHPECARRLHEINNAVISSGLELAVARYDAPLASRRQLELAHDADHVERIFEMAPKAGSVSIDADTSMSPGTLRAARRAAGAGILGIDLLMDGTAGAAFCSVRPPGHHAGRGEAKGFCFFNNIAIAALHALVRHAAERIAIVDFDAHHGDGTEDIVRNDERVLFCSSYQHPFYPYAHKTPAARNAIRVPLAAGSDGAAFRAAVSRLWLPALEAFRPGLVLISAGFDGHILDGMSALCLLERDYAWITQELLAIARRHAGGRILSMLEGGYEPGALARSAVAHMKALLG